jgi:TolB-like protein/AraC-like DNA-binding protein
MNENASMDQLFLEKVHVATEKNLANKDFGVDELAHEIGISRSQLHRRLKNLTGQSASHLIREARLNKAFEMLQQKVATASEISYQVGFSSPSYFNTCFNEYFGYPPGKAKRIRSSGFTTKHTNPRKLIFISLATLMVVVSVFSIYFTVTERKIENTDRSIAVLPFKYLSNDPEKQYLADGVMEAILLHLSKIGDLRVIDRTTVEQYREPAKTAIVIGKELDVAYLLEGSFQIYGDQAKLIVQLIRPGEDGQIWAEEYDRNWEDIFSVQSEVAQTIARELQAFITPEEKELIEKIPTPNLAAYDFYQRGRDEHLKFLLDNNQKEALERAEDLYYEALHYDFTFAQAYTGLAWVFLEKYYSETFYTENFLDSMLILADIALSFDNQLAEAYEVRGDYYRLNCKKEQAIHEYDKAIRFNPNHWWAYYGKGLLFYSDDPVKSIDNLNKVALLHRGSFLPMIYRSTGRSYAAAGFKEISLKYVEEALKLDNDSAAYYSYLAEIEDCNGNFEQAIEFGERSYDIDSTNLWTVFLLGIDHMYKGDFKSSLEYFNKYDKTLRTFDRPYRWEPHLIGYAYWVNGFKEEALDYYESVLEIYNEMLELGRHPFQDFTTYHSLAAIYTFLGDKDKAYEYLRLFNQRQGMPLFMIKEIKNNPLFDTIRNEPEFEQIVRDVEAKYQAEHERVRKWLKERDML